MPPTEQCVLGAENKTNIEAIMREFKEFKAEVRGDIKDIATCVTKLTNHYSKKHGWGVTTIISTLLSVVVGLAMWIITH